MPQIDPANATIPPRQARPIRRVAVVVGSENPSFDYYFGSRFALHPGPPARRYALSATPATLAGISWRDTLLVFCRYVSKAWLEVARANRDALAGVALFVDDDIEAMVRAPELSWHYRLMLRRRAISPWRRLVPMLDRLWVSTPRLAERWQAMSPRLLPPVADAFDLDSTPEPSPRTLVGIHAGGSHRADKAWLEPVVRAVLAAAPEIMFEMVVEEYRDWRWRGDPRVRVIPFRSWPEYRAETAGHGRDILLAPFLPTAVNAARAGVKRIDAARCGAALLVSDPDVYQVSPAETNLGMVVPLDVDSWTRAILGLAGDAGRRQALVRLNREKLLEIRETTPPLFRPAGGEHPDTLDRDAWSLT